MMPPSRVCVCGCEFGSGIVTGQLEWDSPDSRVVGECMEEYVRVRVKGIRLRDQLYY